MQRSQISTRRTSRHVQTLVFASLGLLFLLALAPGRSSESRAQNRTQSDPKPTPSLLTRSPSTAGPAAGPHGKLPALATPDAACAACHQAIYASYELTSKARGSGVAAAGLLPGSFTHEPSGMRYTVATRGGEATLTYRRPQSRGSDEVSGELTLQYFIGSGKRGRTYLFRQPLQEGALWFEAPVNWYTRRAAYGMAPAYDAARSMPFTLPVDANCLHCHASGVEQPLPSARNAFRDAPFQQAGVGCSACHGDGGAHVASGGTVAVVDPRKLDARRRDSLCLQCHLEGDAVVYRPGRSLASFHPGEDLSETAVYFVKQGADQTSHRAASQYEALLRSACRRATGDRLTCTTCHDPHSAPAPADRVAYFRGKCLSCHTGAAMEREHFPRQPDCASCHMPPRSTTDISHEQVTDHDIERKPRAIDRPAAPLPGSDLMQASAPAQTPALAQTSILAQASDEINLVPVGQVQAGDRERGLAYAQFAAQGSRPAFARALSLLRKAEFLGGSDLRLHEELGYLEQVGGHTAAAEREYEAALAIDPNTASTATNLAVLLAAKGDQTGAAALLRRVAANDPAQTAALLNLAVLTCEQGQNDAARELVQRALLFNPDDREAHLFLTKGRYAGRHCELH